MKEVDFVKLLSRALASLSFICDGKISYMCPTQQDFKESETAPESAEGLVNYALNLPGVQMCFWRRKPGKTVSNLTCVPFNLKQRQKLPLILAAAGMYSRLGCTLEMPFEKAAFLYEGAYVAISMLRMVSSIFINRLMTPRRRLLVKRLTGKKAGHAGTLDPEAAGVLPIMIGKATKLNDY